MSVTRVNPKPQMGFTTRYVETASTAYTAGNWKDSSAAIPSVSGYTPIGIVALSPGSPANLTPLAWWLESGSVKVRARSSGSVTTTFGVTIGYVKVS